MTASANLAPPEKPKTFYVVWKGHKGNIVRTIWRWRKDSANRLAQALLKTGIKDVWLLQSGEAPAWDARDPKKPLAASPHRDEIERAFSAMNLK